MNLPFPVLGPIRLTPDIGTLAWAPLNCSGGSPASRTTRAHSPALGRTRDYSDWEICHKSRTRNPRAGWTADRGSTIWQITFCCQAYSIPQGARNKYGTSQRLAGPPSLVTQGRQSFVVEVGFTAGTSVDRTSGRIYPGNHIGFKSFSTS
jgi:hypothetical protein